MGTYTMLDYQRIVEEIQAALASQATLDWDLLRDAAAEYAAACDEVNQRLLECDGLLKKGLRSEAIGAAEGEPSVLDAVAVLDFPELAQWQQLLAAQRMVLPPPLRLDIASDVNMAYAEQAPLAALLKKHRLLALARAPLPVRIDVLREIHLRDGTNPVWLNDLKVFELARHQEAQKEFEAASKERNLSRAAAILRELEDASWLHRPPAELVERARARYAQLAAELAAQEMQGIEIELSSAYAALDVPAGRSARDRWNTCQRVAQLDPEHAIVRRAAAALAWLAEQDGRDDRARSFAAAVAKLEEALEAEADGSRLERLHYAARRYDEEIPERILRRYQERMRLLETVQWRKFVLIGTTVVGLLFLAGAGSGWLIHYRQREATAASAAGALKRLLDESKTAEAERTYADIQRQRPWLVQRPEMVEQRRRLDGLVASEEQRKESFEETMAKVAAALEKARQSASSVDRSHLNEARKLAAAFEEKRRVADFESAFDAHMRELQQALDDRFKDKYETLLSEVETLERKPTGRLTASEAAEIDQCLAKIDSLQQGSQGVTAALSGQLTPLRLRVLALSRQRATDQRQSVLLRGLTTAVGRPGAYRMALEAFAEEYGDAPLSASFQRVLQEGKEPRLWKDFEDWNALLSDGRLKDLGKLSPKEAKELLARATPLLDDAGDCPLAAEFNAKRPFLQAVANRIDESGEPRVNALSALFADRLMSGLWSVVRVTETTTLPKMKTSRRYYLLSDPVPDIEQSRSGQFLPLRVVTGFDLDEMVVTMRADEVERQSSGLSPQARLVAEIEKQSIFQRISNGEWEGGFFSLIKLIAGQEDLDALLKLILLRRVIQTGNQGSHGLEVAFRPLLAQLDSTAIDLTANWLWPNDDNANKSRHLAQRKLSSLYPESLNNCARRAVDVRRQDIAPLPPLPVWIGWLRPVGEGAWSCEGSNQVPTSGQLYVLVPTTSLPGGGHPAWLRIGVCEVSGIRWESSSDDRFLAGRPVFLFPP